MLLFARFRPILGFLYRSFRGTGLGIIAWPLVYELSVSGHKFVIFVYCVIQGLPLYLNTHTHLPISLYNTVFFINVQFVDMIGRTLYEVRAYADMDLDYIVLDHVKPISQDQDDAMYFTKLCTMCMWSNTTLITQHHPKNWVASVFNNPVVCLAFCVWNQC